MMAKKKKKKISSERANARIPKKEEPFKGNTELMISTGSTLLDLAISGERKYGGGIPGGILVQIAGPSSAGKTVLLSEIGGDIQRKGGDVLFNDPEARMDKQFSKMFDFDPAKAIFKQPDTVTEVFNELDEWEPNKKATLNGIMTDSLAALSTTMEMSKKEGDKMGMRRAKEFSEGLRKYCRVLKQKNYLMVCSNQLRVNPDAGPYGSKYTTPGGEAVRYYCSLVLLFKSVSKIKKEISFKGKKEKKIIGTKGTILVDKSSIDSPFREAPIYILFDYGVDDIRANLQFIKEHSSKKYYHVSGDKLDVSMQTSIDMIEEQKREVELKKEVIALWTELQAAFKDTRKRKNR